MLQRIPVRSRYVFRVGGLPVSDAAPYWFDTGAFVQPAPYMFGNQGVNLLRSDGRTVVNLSVLRNFRFGESKKLQFRGELSNLANHADFGNPGATFGGAGFGSVSTATAARRPWSMPSPPTTAASPRWCRMPATRS